MNIESSKINQTNDVKTQKTALPAEDNSGIKFADELKDVAKASNETLKAEENTLETKNTNSPENISQENLTPNLDNNHKNSSSQSTSEITNKKLINNKITNTTNTETNNPIDKTIGNALKGLNSIVEEFNQIENTSTQSVLKEEENFFDIKPQLQATESIKDSITSNEENLNSDFIIDSKNQINEVFDNNFFNPKEKPIIIENKIEPNQTIDMPLKKEKQENHPQNTKTEFNQTEDKITNILKTEENTADNHDTVINNDFNVQENKDLLPQMNPNMNFSGNGQPFSSFMNNEEQEKKSKVILNSSAQELAEEAAILSTMAENIAIANKNQMLKETKIVINEEGIKKVDSQTGIKIENIVKFDTVIMNQADVEVFANLIEKGEINLNEINTKAIEKSAQVSKTLADMLAKSMENNQPLRIDFDNNISVIIRISRDGKITADFLPSSQVAEAYLKENLPLLRQKFDNSNIEYDSLNQKERKDQNRENNNRKKGRNNE